MADITITPSDVRVDKTNAQFKQGIAGEAIDVGDWVYFDGASRTYKKARANASGTASLIGHAVNRAISGGTLYVNETEPMLAGTIFTKDTIYVLSAATAGKIAPLSDLSTGNIIVIAGVASSTSRLVLSIKNTGIAKS